MGFIFREKSFRLNIDKCIYLNRLRHHAEE